MSNVRLILGDCLEMMETLPENSVSSIVCDPPYGINFMSRLWDHGVPGVPFWEAALRVAKPGAHLLAFGGDRTHHRLMVAIEDAGWEIRTCLYWVFGSGFPKSHDVSKAIDRMAGAEREVIGINQSSAKRNSTTFHGAEYKGGWTTNLEGNRLITAPVTDAAKQWDGWGTALKPAAEIIVMARKKLDGTIAQNVLKHGVGGLNVDASRIKANGIEPNARNHKDTERGGVNGGYNGSWGHIDRAWDGAQGRWPANLILDEEAAAMLDQMSAKQMHGAGIARDAKRQVEPTGIFSLAGDGQRYGDTGGASRFFYVAKASKRDRDEGLEGMPLSPSYMVENGSKTSGLDGVRYDRTTLNRNHHPTVKPTQLMRYLVRLVTPPNGTVLDPFAGSGSTLKAAILEGFDCVGIELDPEYLELARRRIEHAQSQARMQLPLLEVV